MASNQNLFRIVNDETPTLPEAISEKLCDFLTRCFQKNESLRVDAITLRNHPWIKNVQKEGEISVDNVASRLTEYKQKMIGIGDQARSSAFPTVRMRRFRQNRSRTISYSILFYSLTIWYHICLTEIAFFFFY